MTKDEQKSKKLRGSINRSVDDWKGYPRNYHELDDYPDDEVAISDDELDTLLGNTDDVDDYYTETEGMTLEGMESGNTSIYEPTLDPERYLAPENDSELATEIEPDQVVAAEPEDTFQRKRMGWKGYLLMALLVFGIVFGGVTLFRNAASNFGVTEQTSINQTQQEVDELFGTDGRIRAKLAREEWEAVRQKVEMLEDSPQKVKLRTQIESAKEQIDSQTDAEALVNGLYLNDEPYIDMHLNSMPARVTEFPINYNTEYARELQDKYNIAYDAIERVKTIEQDFYVAIEQPDFNLTVLESFRSSIEGLPTSNTKNRMGAEFNNQAQRLSREAELAEQRRIEEARIQQEQDAQIQEQLRIQQEQQLAQQQQQYEQQLAEQQRIEYELEQERLRLQAEWEAEQAWLQQQQQQQPQPEEPSNEPVMPNFE